MKRILFVGGGTLGSLVPLIAVAHEVRKERTDVDCFFLVSTDRRERELIAGEHFPCMTLRVGKWRRYVDVRNVTDIFLSAFALIRAVMILFRLRPSVIVSAGSFVSVPVIWASRLFGTAVLLHQQDLQPGLANRLTAWCASEITTALPVHEKSFSAKRTVQWTGNPVREGVLHGNASQCRQHFGFSETKPTLLVLGGSTGAEALNETIASEKERFGSFANVLHVVGRRGTVTRAGGYVSVEFLGKELADAFALADVVVTRAGLSTLSELALLGKPTIIVPMPHSHQEENARYFAEHNGAIVVAQDAHVNETLFTAIRTLLTDREEKVRLSTAITHLNSPAAASKIARAALALMK